MNIKKFFRELFCFHNWKLTGITKPKMRHKPVNHGIADFKESYWCSRCCKTKIKRMAIVRSAGKSVDCSTFDAAD